MKSTENVRVGLTLFDMTLPFFVTLSKAAGEKATELGVELLAAHPATYAVAEQMSIIEEFVRQQVDAFIIAAADSKGIVPAVEKANQAGIPVIAVDVEIWGGEIACTVQTDNLKGAELAAEYIAERLGYKGKVVNIQGLLSSQASFHRSQGLHHVLDRYPDLGVVFEQEAGWNVAEGGQQAMAEALSAYPDIDAVFAANDPLLLGALQVVKAAGKLGQIIMVGFDAIPEVLVLIDKGQIDASVQQFPDRIGATAVAIALKAIHGEEVPARVDTGTALISRDNVHEAAMNNLQALAGLTQDLIQARAETERMNIQIQRQSQEIIDAQRQALRELSTPIVPVSDEIITMPLIGSIDTVRARQIMEALLVAISRYQAEVVIIDITGVPVVDTGVANHLLQTARAARLLGSRVMLTGLSPEVAQTVVSLGVDLSGLVTRSNLQSGIEYALGLVQKRIVAL
jgi:ribose transport system substrate-binding protein